MMHKCAQNKSKFGVNWSISSGSCGIFMSISRVVGFFPDNWFSLFISSCPVISFGFQMFA